MDLTKGFSTYATDWKWLKVRCVYDTFWDVFAYGHDDWFAKRTLLLQQIPRVLCGL